MLGIWKRYNTFQCRSRESLGNNAKYLSLSYDPGAMPLDTKNIFGVILTWKPVAARSEFEVTSRFAVSERGMLFRCKDASIYAFISPSWILNQINQLVFHFQTLWGIALRICNLNFPSTKKNCKLTRIEQQFWARAKNKCQHFLLPNREAHKNGLI